HRITGSTDMAVTRQRGYLKNFGINKMAEVFTDGTDPITALSSIEVLNVLEVAPVQVRGIALIEREDLGTKHRVLLTAREVGDFTSPATTVVTRRDVLDVVKAIERIDVLVVLFPVYKTAGDESVLQSGRNSTRHKGELGYLV